MRYAILIWILGLLLVPRPGQTADLTPEQILQKIDDNVYAESRYATSRMVVVNRRGRRREMQMKSWMVGDEKSFSEYTAPERERGTKMLKVGNNLWTYSPRTDRIVHIAGHLLRQSIMGSDLSYEDAMEEVRLRERYVATHEPEEELDGRSCFVLLLTARDEGAAYATRRLWVDGERFIPLKELRYGKSGRLLKSIQLLDVKRIEERWYPTRVRYKDELKDGDGTEFIMDELKFNPPIPENLFSKQSLRR